MEGARLLVVARAAWAANGLGHSHNLPALAREEPGWAAWACGRGASLDSMAGHGPRRVMPCLPLHPPRPGAAAKAEGLCQGTRPVGEGRGGGRDAEHTHLHTYTYTHTFSLVVCATASNADKNERARDTPGQMVANPLGNSGFAVWLTNAEVPRALPGQPSARAALRCSELVSKGCLASDCTGHRLGSCSCCRGGVIRLRPFLPSVPWDVRIHTLPQPCCSLLQGRDLASLS